VAQQEARPTATYLVSKADQPKVLEQFRGRQGIDLPRGPYESWRVKLSDGTSQATAIMYQSGKLTLEVCRQRGGVRAQVCCVAGRAADPTPGEGNAMAPGGGETSFAGACHLGPESWFYPSRDDHETPELFLGLRVASTIARTQALSG
jgi:hypothetical protein